MAFVPEEPALATVVATVTPVVELAVVADVPVSPPAPRINPLPCVTNDEPESGAWVWPGSVTEDVAVWVCETTIASAEPPVALTA